MKAETKYKIWIGVLAGMFGLSCSAFYYVAFEKTDFSKRMMAKINHDVYIQERQDDGCVNSWNNSITKLNMQADVVFFGDSETAGGDFQEAFPDVKSINLGYIGEDTKGMLRRVDAIAAVKPKKVFLMAGINGLKNQTMSNFEYWYSVLVDSIRNAVPDAELYVESILPVTASSDYCDNAKIREANAILRHLTSERNIHFIDLYDAYVNDGALPDDMSYDGLHLTDEAYSVWYHTIKEYINDQTLLHSAGI